MSAFRFPSLDSMFRWIAFAAILLCNFYLLRSFTSLTDELSIRPYGPSSKLLDAIISLRSNPELEFGGKKYQLVFLASAESCPAAADELVSLGSLAANRPDIGIVAVIAGLSNKEVEELNRSLDLPYRVLTASEALPGMQALEFANPQKILLEVGRRRPLFLDGSAPTETERRAYRARLERIR
jgi:hypothetical protein